MPASLIIIAALTCFILWFRCLLLSIALGCDLQWQVLEVRRQPLIMQLQLVESETCCGLLLKGSYMFLRRVLPCFKQLGGERPGPACPILPTWPVLSIPSNSGLLLALSSMKSPQPKHSCSVYSSSKSGGGGVGCWFWGLFFLLVWVIGNVKAGPGAMQPSALRCPRKAFQRHHSFPSFCHIKDSLTREIYFL